CKKDVVKNILFVASDPNDEHLLSDSALINQLNWNSIEPKEGTKLNAKFRYRQKDLPVIITKKQNGDVLLTFPKPYKALTPGQACVFYDGDFCLGGGIIDKVFYKGEQIN
ncbi:MAG: tRNA 2-thiouridine(34) synthase MnmA, partial [Erysipelotrichaceae bacterium]|nr:tRNA 2-thiouridine(34) synthase MnmA [Erysipelotrichaceae bacterium]